MAGVHKISAAAVAALLMLVMAVPAMGAESSGSGYSTDDTEVGEELGVVQEGPVEDGGEADGDAGGEQAAVVPTEGGGGGAGDSAAIGGLPFTGLDLGLIGIAGTLLALLGFGLRRVTTGHSPAA